jgi:hypothetical protein
MKWMSKYLTIYGNEDSEVPVPCIRVHYSLPEANKVLRTVVTGTKTDIDGVIGAKGLTVAELRDNTNYDNITMHFEMKFGSMMIKPDQSQFDVDLSNKVSLAGQNYSQFAPWKGSGSQDTATLGRLEADQDTSENEYSLYRMRLREKQDRMSLDADRLRKSQVACDPYETPCSYVELDFRPSVMDGDKNGYFDVCDMVYFPPENFNSVRDEEDELRVTAVLPNSTDQYDAVAEGRGLSRYR